MMKGRTEFRLRRAVAAVLGVAALGVVAPITVIAPGVASAEPRIEITPPNSSKPHPKPYPYYVNCQQVRAEGKAPLLAGQPGYSRQLDPDGNGVACG